MHAKLYTILIITLTCGLPHRVSSTRDIYIATEERRDCLEITIVDLHGTGAILMFRGRLVLVILILMNRPLKVK